MQATTHYQDYELIAEWSKGLGKAMDGLDVSLLKPEERMQDRGW